MRALCGSDGLGTHRDDLCLARALSARGLAVDVRPWDDPVDWATVALVVIRTPWDYFARLEEFLAWVRRVDRATRLCNPLAIIEANIHKGYLLALEAAGVPVVPTTLVTRGAPASAQRRALATNPGEVVIKPAVSCGGVGALRVPARDEVATAHLKGLVAEGDALVQPLVPSVVEEGEVSLVYLGGDYSHAVRKVAAPGDYRVQDDHGGTIHPHQAHPDELAVAAAALAGLPERPAYARVDLVSYQGAPAVMELELIEPELFLPFHPDAAGRLAALLAGLLPGVTRG
jgi:glutathione synthase/RimK-type ligase-like ATP-grasp enzyme